MMLEIFSRKQAVGLVNYILGNTKLLLELLETNSCFDLPQLCIICLKIIRFSKLKVTSSKTCSQINGESYTILINIYIYVMLPLYITNNNV